MKRPRRLLIGLATILALLLGGCGTDQPQAPGTPAPIGQTPLPVEEPGQFNPGPPAAP